MKEKIKRMSTFAICLGLACFFLTGNVLAGTTATTVVELGDCTQGVPNRVIPLPDANEVTRLMSVLRGTGADFFVDVSLSDKVEWDTTLPPIGLELTFTRIAPAFYTATLLGTPAGTSTATYSVFVTNGTPLDFPLATFNATNLAITDVNNVLGTGGTISITIATRDAATGMPIDVSTDTVDWLNVAGPSCPPPPPRLHRYRRIN